MKYTIGSIVSDWHQYDAMQKSFMASGFLQGDCQYIPINNVGENRFCMYSGGNAVLTQSLGEYVILAHQDVRAIHDSVKELDRCIDELNSLDPSWAVAGNAGSTDGGWFTRITDAYGENQRTAPHYPCKVDIIDGNLLIIKNRSRVSFSRDLSGFHYYGWDICLNADTLGYASYVVDFHVSHLGSGNVNDHFYGCKEAFEKKWSRAIRPRSLGAFQHDKVTLS